MADIDVLRVTSTRSVTSSIAERAANAATQRALDGVIAKIPASARRHLPLARRLTNGGVSGLIDAGLDSLFERYGINGTTLPGIGDKTGPSVTLGGLTLQQAREQFEDHIGRDFAKKNLWCIRVRNLNGGTPLDINVFAMDVGYSAFTAAGEAVQVGSASFDNLTGAERVELRITTLDDSYGSVKRWFSERYGQMCHRDGTFGLPIDYLFRVDVLHAYVNESVDGAGNGWIDTFIMRPGSLESDFSRRDDALSELQMSFIQWDTFAALP